MAAVFHDEAGRLTAALVKRLGDFDLAEECVQDALVAALRSGRLRAAVDVTNPEPLPAGHPLWNAPGVFITPHVGGQSAADVDVAAGS